MSSPTIPRRRQRSDASSHVESESPSSSPPRSNTKRPRLNQTDGVDSSSDESVKSEDSDNDSTSHTLSERGSGNRGQRLDSASENGAESDSHQNFNDEAEDSDNSDEQRSSQNNDDSERPSEDEEDGDSMPPPQQPLRALAGLSPEGYKPGAIVRIKVTNFVTYKSAEFFPGPKLNMVIGPNGTGKSTLVCAICLGLGWGPIHLGRAKEVGEFVKHGNQEAFIEIELQKAPGTSRNPIITRTIKRDGNKSTFTLNGSPASNKTVLQLARKFAIQVDNLCQFLPQDKVAEFAGLTPIDLLHSTQRAASGEEMIENHDALKTLRREQKQLQMNNREDQQMLRDLKNRQEGQRPDVDRMRKRAEVQERLAIFEKLRPWVKLRDFTKEFKGLKDEMDREEQEYEQLSKDLEPAMAAVHVKEAYKNQISEVKTQRSRQVQQFSRVAGVRGKNVERLEDTIKEIESKIEAEKRNGGKSREDVTAAIQSINRLKRQQQEAPVELDLDYYNGQLRDKRLELRDIIDKGESINTAKMPLAREQHSVKTRIKEEEGILANLDTQMGKQEVQLRRLSGDTFKAYRWILENQDKFEGEVFGPPIVTCSVTDSRYAPAIESMMSKTDLLSFTVQSTVDFRKLQRLLVTQLGLSDISIKTCTSLAPLSRPRPNLDLQQLGLDGWAQDYVTGPDYVLASLCDNNALRKTPIGLRDISDQTFNALQNNPAVVSWVAARKSYKVSRRADLGDWAKSTSTKTIRPANVWNSQPIDASVKKGHEDTIRDLKVRLEQIEEEMKAQRDEMQELNRQRKRVEQETQMIEKEKSQKQTEFTEYRSIPQKLEIQEGKKEKAEERLAACRQRVINFRNEQGEKAVEKAEAAIAYATAVEKFQKAFEELLHVEILFLEATSDHLAVQALHARYGKQIQDKLAVLEGVKAAFDQARAQGRSLRRAGHAARDEVLEMAGGEEIFQPTCQEGYNMDAFNADLDSAQAEIELNAVSGSAGLIQEYEEREQRIGSLEAKLATFHAQLDNIQSAIDEVRADWEPKLDALIQKISDAFSDSFQRIGCAGQVGLDKVVTEGEDGEPPGVEFDRWSIQIHVKFRQNASLSLLDSHRQSGGERAVSTIFYLMALQSLSASPFRVVDEINQGMDPRNERMVHGRLVDIACASVEESDEIGGGGGGQYFLITPKLLSGLSYKPGMRVLCIWSGEHMPSDYGTLNVPLAIRNMKKILADGKKTPASTAESEGASQSQSQVSVYA